jgi:prolyl-tRNA editing enzyme YbaK/EbsC (Cys-tRNA(Pro) deacylase)
MNSVKLSLNKILHKKQEYVKLISNELGFEITGLEHKISTDTCFEKAKLLGWKTNRIIKAIYLSNRIERYGFIFPELGEGISPQRISTENLSELLGISKKKAKSFCNIDCPEGMEWGTCTPFVFDNAFDNNLDGKLNQLFYHNFDSLNCENVDISIGGFGERAHRISLHLQYEGIYEILKYKFGDKITKTELF